MVAASVLHTGVLRRPRRSVDGMGKRKKKKKEEEDHKFKKLRIPEISLTTSGFEPDFKEAQSIRIKKRKKKKKGKW